MPLISSFKYFDAGARLQTATFPIGASLRVHARPTRDFSWNALLGAMAETDSPASRIAEYIVMPRADTEYIQGIGQSLPDSARRFIFLGFQYSASPARLFEFGWDEEGVPVIGGPDALARFSIRVIACSEAANHGSGWIPFSPISFPTPSHLPCFTPAQLGTRLITRCRREKLTATPRGTERYRLLQVKLERGTPMVLTEAEALYVEQALDAVRRAEVTNSLWRTEHHSHQFRHHRYMAAPRPLIAEDEEVQRPPAGGRNVVDAMFGAIASMPIPAPPIPPAWFTDDPLREESTTSSSSSSQ